MRRLILAGSFAALTLSACTTLGGTPQSVASASDEQLVTLARGTTEAQAFLARFPGAATSVDRSGRVGVDFRGGDPGIRLRVFIVDGPKAGGSFLECPRAQLIQENVADAVRRGCAG